MDVHAPDKPVHSLRDFAVHIAIVTIGILIALSLEGIREGIHDHGLVSETRENFQKEFKIAKEHDTDEFARVHKGNLALHALVADMPGFQKEPAQVLKRLDAVRNPNYFFTTYSLQAALSTEALAHMSPVESQRMQELSKL